MRINYDNPQLIVKQHRVREPEVYMLITEPVADNRELIQPSQYRVQDNASPPMIAFRLMGRSLP
jgi:hypothetical protein